MYRMSIMTMLAPTTLGLDLVKCMRMALIHDMAEALVGDITPGDNVDKPDKSRAERDTMEYIAQKLLPKVGSGLTGEAILEIWDEYEGNCTKEAKFVHDVDKLELLMQVLEYEKSRNKLLDEYNGVADGILLPETRAWCDEIQNDRIKLRESRGQTPHLPIQEKDNREKAIANS
jgi:putative hydrolases of HD superfamily